MSIKPTMKEHMQPDSTFEDQITFVKNEIQKQGFTIADTELERPWGGFFRLSNNDAEKFASLYFHDTAFATHENMSPKFLIVRPGKRLSWQYHIKRAEIWKVLRGPVAVKLSETDTEPSQETILEEGEGITFGPEVRHRLIGVGNNYGIVTEIWHHTNADDLSNESDIVRVQDDFGR